jgi:2-dehydropantoate 2-reductase
LGDHVADVAVAERLSDPVDVLWVAVKAGQLAGALSQAPPEHVREVVIPLLNGIDHMARLREIYGADRVAAGTIRVESEREAPGEIRQLGPMVATELAGPPRLRPVLERVAADLGATGIRVQVDEDPDLALWQKLIMLAPFALTSTASGLALGGIADDPRWRGLMLGCMREVKEVAAAQGIELAAPTGMLEVAPRGMRTSMQKDAAAGRPIELDAIGGAVLRAAERAGTGAPVTARLVADLRARYG